MNKELIELSIEYKYLHITNNTLCYELFIYDLINYLNKLFNIELLYNTSKYISLNYNNKQILIDLTNGLTVYFEKTINKEILEILNYICDTTYTINKHYDKDTTYIVISFNKSISKTLKKGSI